MPDGKKECEKLCIIEESVTGQITFSSRDTLNIRRDYANASSPDHKIFRGARPSEMDISQLSSTEPTIFTVPITVIRSSVSSIIDNKRDIFFFSN